MNDFTVTFYNKDKTKPLVDLGNIKFDVKPYTHSIYGGPKSGKVIAVGQEEDLWKLFYLIKNPVEINNKKGDKVFWGIVKGVEISTEAITIGASLDKMANAISVAYTFREPGSSVGTTRGTTAWAINQESIDLFGRKELRFAQSGSNEQQAEKDRDNLLERLKKPVGTNWNLGFNESEPKVTLYLAGWVYIIDWLYYSNNTGFIENTSDDKAMQKIGRPIIEGTNIGFENVGGDNYIYRITGTLDHLESGDKIFVSGSTSNDGEYTIRNVLEQPESEIIDTDIGFLQSSEGNYLAKFDNNALASILRDTYLRVTGSVSNDGVYKVEEGAQGEYNVFNDTFMGFYVSSGQYSIYQTEGGLQKIDEGDPLKVSGSTSNDGIYTVTKVFKRNKRTYAASTISFHDEPGGDKIKDSADGLGVFEVGDVIKISGSSLPDNNGYNRIISKSEDGDQITVDTDLDTVVAGDSITITAGNSVEVAESLTTEDAGANVTIESGRYIKLREQTTRENTGNSITVKVGNFVKVEETLVTEAVGANVTLDHESRDLKQTVDLDGQDFHLKYITVVASKTGTPSDKLRVTVSHDGNSQNIDIESAEIAESVNKFVLDFSQLLNPLFLDDINGTAEIAIERTGAESLENFYNIQIDTAGTYTEDLEYNRLGSYHIATENLIFKISGTWSTDRQMGNILSSAQFIQGYSVVDTDIKTSPYRGGDTTSLDELLELIKIGTNDGSILIMNITPKRYLSIKKALNESYHIFLDSENNIYNKVGQESNLDKTKCPVGVWVKLKDVIPVPIGHRLVDPSPFFVEEATYYPDRDIWIPEPLESDSVWGVGEGSRG